jgi:hypothetical protein
MVKWLSIGAGLGIGATLGFALLHEAACQIAKLFELKG